MIYWLTKVLFLTLVHAQQFLLKQHCPPRCPYHPIFSCLTLIPFLRDSPSLKDESISVRAGGSVPAAFFTSSVLCFLSSFLFSFCFLSLAALLALVAACFFFYLDSFCFSSVSSSVTELADSPTIFFDMDWTVAVSAESVNICFSFMFCS